MTALSNTKELALKSDAFKDGDFAGKVFIVVSFGHYSVDHGKIEKFIVDYIKEKGGEVRSSAVKNLDYVIVCTRVNLMYAGGALFDWVNIEEGGSESHKTGCQMYNNARKLQKEGKDVRFISDIDLFLHESLFSKLPAFDKKRLIAECCKGNKSFDAKDLKSVATFMKKNLATDPDFDDLRKEGIDLTAYFDQINGTSAKSTLEGKKISFGTYPYTENGDKRPINWIILKEEADTLLLISENVLDLVYHDTHIPGDYHGFNFYDGNGNAFFPSAFSADELSAIVASDVSKSISTVANSNTTQPETVFFLSKKECESLFSGRDDLIAKATPYLLNRMSFRMRYISEKSCAWYLRTKTIGENFYGKISRDGHYSVSDSPAARPAIRVKKSYLSGVTD